MNMEYNFSEDLKSIREILGFSQSELAEKIGVEQVTISRNELKKQNHRQGFWKQYIRLHLIKT